MKAIFSGFLYSTLDRTQIKSVCLTEWMIQSGGIPSARWGDGQQSQCSLNSIVYYKKENRIDLSLVRCRKRKIIAKKMLKLLFFV